MESSVITVESRVTIVDLLLESVGKLVITVELFVINGRIASHNCQIKTYNSFVSENAEIFANYLLPSFNNSFTKSEFPAFFKIVVLTLLFKEGEKNKKENYRPVGILPKCQKYLTYFAKYQIS